MKKLYTLFLIMQIVVYTSAQTAGTFDSSFATDGMAIYNWQQNHYPFYLIEQPDGKLLVGGSKEGKYFIMRINSDSTLDAGFGINGILEDSLPGYNNNNINAMHLQPNGNIVISITFSNISAGMFGYARYLSTGIIDSTFGTNGYVLKSSSTNLHYRNLISPLFNNQYVIGESIDSMGNFTTTFERLNNDGTLDATFGIAGSVVLSDFLMENTAWLSSGKFVFFGFELFATGYSLIRYNTNGVIDSSYGTNGTVLEPFITATSLSNIFADSAGNTFTTLQYGFPNSTFRISKFDLTGAKDAGFGIAGDKELMSDKYLNSLAFEPGGKIIAGGHHTNATGSENLLQRWLADGTDDVAFANAGELLFTSAAQSSENASSTLLSHSGKIYVLSTGYLQSTQDNFFFVSRFHNDIGVGMNDVIAHQNDFIIYPNPANNELNISLFQYSTNDKVELKVVDAIGKENYFSDIKTVDFKLAISNWVEGIYFVQLKNNKYSVTKKIVIHH